jgi:hypothetical protein
MSSSAACATPKPARATRWSCRSLPASGSDRAAWANITWRGVNALGFAVASAGRERKKVIWKPSGSPLSVLSQPVRYHHSMR